MCDQVRLSDYTSSFRLLMATPDSSLCAPLLVCWSLQCLQRRSPSLRQGPKSVSSSDQSGSPKTPLDGSLPSSEPCCPS